ncbi:MAG: hypothetical protein KDN22_16920 [Verrucomicrobiae bacterium]|nr:hypothetical protein [Verrucomicrobiae bacterium]
MTLENYTFKPRQYLHFDSPKSKASALALVTDPVRVARHSFYPFLGYTIKVRKIKRENGLRVKKIKERDIKIAAHGDAAIYSYYGKHLSQLYESRLKDVGLSDAVTAFRSLPEGGTNIDFAGDVFRFINGHRPCVALAFDVEKFFDTLDHNYLKDAWASVLDAERLPPDHFAVFRSLTRFSWVDREDAYKALGISPHNPKPKGQNRRRLCKPEAFRGTIRGAGLLRWNPRINEGRGIPQGSPMSAVLSNIYMLDFDRIMHEAVTAIGGLYRRYCDDIMIVVDLENREAIETLVYQRLEAISLNANKEKTDRVAFQADLSAPSITPLQYLGFTFDGTRTLLRQGSLDRYYSKMRRGVSLAKQTQRKFNRKEHRTGVPLTKLRRRKLHLQYSYLINRRRHGLSNSDPQANGNFLTYAYKAARKLKTPDIKHQVRNHWRKLNEEIAKPIHGQLTDC